VSVALVLGENWVTVCVARLKCLTHNGDDKHNLIIRVSLDILLHTSLPCSLLYCTEVNMPVDFVWLFVIL
jgi:hypothetical protein